MAKKNESGYLSAKESRRISRENRKITDQFEKLHKRKNVPEEEFLTQMHDQNNSLEIENLHTYFFSDVGTVRAVAGVSFAVPLGKPVGVVMARVNEYWNLLREEGTHAADCCLNTAAGILQLAAGPDQQNAVVRLEDGIFLVVSVGTPAAKLQAALHEALGESRRTFGITLSRRGEFTVSLSSADWGEAGSWDLMVALAEQRLSGC